MQVAEFFASLGLKTDKGSFAVGEKAMGGLKGGVLKLGAAIGGALGLDALKEMVKGTVDLGSNLNDTAQKTGLSTDALQYLGYVAKLNSGSMESVSFAAKFMARNLLQAEKGSGDAADALTKLKINANDPAFKRLTVDEKFQKISAALAALPDGTEKSALAMQVFGRAGADLIPTINDLGQNGAKLRKEFEDFGGGLSKKQTEDLDNFGDDLDRMKTRLGQLKDQAVVQVLPLLQKGLTGLTNWIKENKSTITGGITGAIKVVIEVMRALGDTFVFISKHKDLAITLAIVGAALYAWFNPVQAIIIGLIAIIHYWPQIARAALSTWNSVKRAVGEAWDYIKAIPGRIGAAFGRAWDSVKTAAKDAFDWIINLPVIKQLIEIYRYFTSRSAAETAAAANLDKAQSQLDAARASGNGSDVAKAQLAYDQAQQQQANAYGYGNVGIGGFLRQQQIANDQTTIAAVGGGGGTTVISSVGDINVTVPPGTDADGVAKAVANHVQRVINQAHDAVKGGVK